MLATKKKPTGTQLHFRKQNSFMPVCGHPHARKFANNFVDVTCGNCKQGEVLNPSRGSSRTRQSSTNHAPTPELSAAIGNNL